MKEIEIIARSEEEALGKAAERLGASPGDIHIVEEYEPDDDDLAVLDREEAGQDIADDAPEPVLYVLRVGMGPYLRAAEEFGNGLVGKFQPGATCEAIPRGDHLRLYIHAVEPSILIGRDGATLNALQHICNRALPRWNQSDGKEDRDFPLVLLDIEDYLDRKHERLERIADRAVGKAKKTRRKVSLKPMTSMDRKYVHNYLKEQGGIETYSEGRDPYRYIVIEPKGGRRGGGRSEAPPRSGPKQGPKNGNLLTPEEAEERRRREEFFTPPTDDLYEEETDDEENFDDVEIEEHESRLPPYQEPEDDKRDRPLVDELEFE